MNKKMLVAGLLTMSAMSVSMMASDLQYFLGAGASKVYSNYNASVSVPSINYISDTSGEMDDIGLMVKTGIIANKTHRFSVIYNGYSEDNTDTKTLVGAYDYLIPLGKSFRLYGGIHAGAIQLEVDDQSKDLGIAYGAQIGSIIDITKNIEFEFGASYSRYTVDREFNGKIGSVPYIATAEIEDATQMFASLNYKF